MEKDKFAELMSKGDVEAVCKHLGITIEQYNRYVEAGRKSFCGVQNEDVLRQAGLLPGGCTDREAVNYFVEHGEELESLGLI